LSGQEADRENHNPDSQNDEQSFPESLSIPDWFATLKGDRFAEVNKVWNEIGYQPPPIE